MWNTRLFSEGTHSRSLKLSDAEHTRYELERFIESKVPCRKVNVKDSRRPTTLSPSLSPMQKTLSHCCPVQTHRRLWVLPCLQCNWCILHVHFVSGPLLVSQRIGVFDQHCPRYTSANCTFILPVLLTIRTISTLLDFDFGCFRPATFNTKVGVLGCRVVCSGCSGFCQRFGAPRKNIFESQAQTAWCPKKKQESPPPKKKNIEFLCEEGSLTKKGGGEGREGERVQITKPLVRG